MDDKKLEIMHQIMEFTDEELKGSMLVIHFWNNMVKENIVSKDDLGNISNLTNDKKEKIKDFVSNKLREHIERNNNGNKKKEES